MHNKCKNSITKKSKGKNGSPVDNKFDKIGGVWCNGGGSGWEVSGIEVVVDRVVAVVVQGVAVVGCKERGVAVQGVAAAAVKKLGVAAVKELRQ